MTFEIADARVPHEKKYYIEEFTKLKNQVENQVKKQEEKKVNVETPIITEALRKRTGDLLLEIQSNPVFCPQLRKFARDANEFIKEGFIVPRGSYYNVTSGLRDCVVRTISLLDRYDPKLRPLVLDEGFFRGFDLSKQKGLSDKLKKLIEFFSKVEQISEFFSYVQGVLYLLIHDTNVPEELKNFAKEQYEKLFAENTFIGNHYIIADELNNIEKTEARYIAMYDKCCRVIQSILGVLSNYDDFKRKPEEAISGEDKKYLTDFSALLAKAMPSYPLVDSKSDDKCLLTPRQYRGSFFRQAIPNSREDLFRLLAELLRRTEIARNSQDMTMVLRELKNLCERVVCSKEIAIELKSSFSELRPKIDYSYFKSLELFSQHTIEAQCHSAKGKTLSDISDWCKSLRSEVKEYDESLSGKLNMAQRILASIMG